MRRKWYNTLHVDQCKKIGIQICMLLFTTFNLYALSAPPVDISGTVVDENGDVVIGANIIVENTFNGTVTNMDGFFRISVPDETTVLVVSSIGYESQRIVVGNQREIRIILKENVQELEEIVVVGYGAQKKETVTGAISSVSNKDLIKSPVANVSNALVGRISGLTAVQTSGEPGASSSTIRIRGIGTYSGDQNPLLVVDGIVQDISSLDLIDPNEIENINVLKDASATAVYGVRGANGVIIVSTKKGKLGKPQIQLTTNFGWSRPTELIKLASSYEYAVLRNEASINDGVSDPNRFFSDDALWKFKNNRDYTQAEIDAMTHLTEEQKKALADSPALYYTSTDYIKEVFDNVAPQQQYNINISGGTDKVTYFTSIGYMNQKGLTSDYGFDNSPSDTYSRRYNFRNNFELNIIKNLEINIGIAGQVVNGRFFMDDYGDTNLALRYRDILKNIYDLVPFSGPGIVDGKVITNYAGDPPINPATGGGGWSVMGTLLRRQIGHSTSSTLNTFVRLKHKMDYLTKGLSVRGAISYDDNFLKRVNESSDIPTYSVMRDPSNPTDFLFFGGQVYEKSYSEKSWYKQRRFYLEGGVDYFRSFDKHTVSAMALVTAERFTKPGLLYNVPQGVYGIVGRATYNYDEKYLVEFNMGYNGSENFLPGKQFGFFPAASAGWVVTNESWFPQNNILTWLKLRGSYGQTGNSNIGGKRFLYLPSSWASNGNIWDPLQGYYFGYTNGTTNSPEFPGKYEQSVGNPNVTWERKISYNLALEIKLFKNRLSLIGDLFSEKRDNILTTIETVPGVIGMSSSVLPPVNVGKMKNEGYELQLSWRDHAGDFYYELGGQVSYAKNTIEYMAEPQYDYPWMNKTGFSYGQYKAYRNDGFYNTAEEAANHPYFATGGNLVQPGDLKIIDVTGDGVIDERDKVPTGYSSLPRYSFSWNIYLAYKGFDISALFTGTAQGTFAMTGYSINPFSQNYGQALQYMYDGRWTPEKYAAGDKILYPRASLNTSNSRNGESNEFWYRSTNHVKFKNLEIGYTFSNINFLKKINISSVRIYTNANNLYTFGGKDLIEGIDPELSQDYFNSDGVIYPILRTYNLGLKVQF